MKIPTYAEFLVETYSYHPLEEEQSASINLPISVVMIRLHPKAEP